MRKLQVMPSAIEALKYWKQTDDKKFIVPTRSSVGMSSTTFQRRVFQFQSNPYNKFRISRKTTDNMDRVFWLKSDKTCSFLPTLADSDNIMLSNQFNN